MRVRPTTSALVGACAAPVAHAALAAMLLAACADPPSAPPAALPEASRPAPSGASHELANMVAGPGDVVAPGDSIAFADVIARGGWMEPFDVNAPVPSTWFKPPAPWRPTDPISLQAIAAVSPNSLADWAIVKQTRDPSRWYAMEPMMAWHGSMCQKPDDPTEPRHLVDRYDDAVFLCRNHMMTATNASGYGVTYLTPNRLLSLGTGDAVVRFDVTTLRASNRDWIDVWITPYEANLVVPLDDSLPDAQGYPAAGFHVRMTAGNRAGSRFEASIIANHHAFRIAPTSDSTSEQVFARTRDPGSLSIDATTGEPVFTPLAPSATRRDTFELRLTNGRLKFGMPRYKLWWYDVAVPPTLGGPSALAVVQIGHHSFNPTADGAPETWHWDNIGMAPAVRFSIVNATRRYVDGASTGGVDFVRAAPAQSNLRFAGYGSSFEVRFNGGKWQKAQRQREELDVDGRFHSYWTPVPAGTQHVDIRADNDPSNRQARPAVWMARDLSIWSLNP